MDVSLSEFGHEYVCIFRATDCSLGTALYLKVKLWAKNEIV